MLVTFYEFALSRHYQSESPKVSEVSSPINQNKKWRVWICNHRIILSNFHPTATVCSLRLISSLTASTTLCTLSTVVCRQQQQQQKRHTQPLEFTWNWSKLIVMWKPRSCRKDNKKIVSFFIYNFCGFFSRFFVRQVSFIALKWLAAADCRRVDLETDEISEFHRAWVEWILAKHDRIQGFPFLPFLLIFKNFCV